MSKFSDRLIESCKQASQQMDRELLELAAKAHGRIAFDSLRLSSLFLDQDRDLAHWNPLTDDGDALRLAVKLNIELHLDLTVGSVVTAFTVGNLGYNTHEEVNENGDCPYAATRRAIVRAAAEIGRAMP